ncbi:MAG: membrane protein insertase YidC [Steroidobacteraceae bacterium]|jgi:YidC/Oxa1 family membrane protein insertase
MPTTINLRLALWALLGMALFLNYQMWSHDYAEVLTPGTVGGSAAPAAPLDSTVPAATPGASAADSGTAAKPAAGAASSASADSAHGLVAHALVADSPTAPSVHVVTDVLDAEISLAGGELRRVDLLAYPQAKNTPDVPVRLLNRDAPDSLFVLQSGLAPVNDEFAPTHQALYSTDVRELRLKSGQQELKLPLQWSDGHGVTVTKTLSFRRGQYQIGLDYQVQNGSAAPWSFAPYAQILRYNAPVDRSYFRPDSYAFKGPAIYDGIKYQKFDIQKNPVLDQSIKSGWLAALQHHFVAAIVPPADAAYRYQLQTQGNEFLLKAQGPTAVVPAGAGATTHDTLFVGPKIQTQLDAAQSHLDLVADYGTLRIIATPLFWLLDHVHSLVSNWGFAIIIVTMLLKLLFYPLAEASGRSMAKMKALAPRLNNLRETYKDDREKLNRGMMELYKREKVNPLVGCLPMLIQIPVFLAFYWVLRDSVELRQAPFILWIDDLSARDPYFVLPAIMAAAMFVQYKINPQVGDPAQQKLFMFMPLAMSVTFAFFPAGLVLYWVTNTVLSILQQWSINRRIEAAIRARR